MFDTTKEDLKDILRKVDDAPSAYLKHIENKQGISSDELDTILRTHLIEPKYLRTDDFEQFYAARQEALEGLVAEAMHKPRRARSWHRRAGGGNSR